LRRHTGSQLGKRRGQSLVPTGYRQVRRAHDGHSGPSAHRLAPAIVVSPTASSRKNSTVRNVSTMRHTPQSRQRLKAARQSRQTAFLASSNINRRSHTKRGRHASSASFSTTSVPGSNWKFFGSSGAPPRLSGIIVIELKSVLVRVCPAGGAKLVPLDLIYHAQWRANCLSPQPARRADRAPPVHLIPPLPRQSY
jgi:hypothetical protein